MRGDENEVVNGDRRGTRRHLYTGTFGNMVDDIPF
jgi:hypothetical protein